MGFAASPFVALYRLANDLERRDVAAIEARVSLGQLRTSLTRELVRAHVDALGGERLGAPERQMAVGAALAVAEPFVARFATAEALIRILGDARAPAQASGAGEPRAAERRDGSWARTRSLLRLVAAAETRGFTRIRMPFPPDAAPAERFGVELRFTRGAWKLVGLQLPAHLQRRLLQELPGGARLSPVAAEPRSRAPRGERRPAT